MNRKPPQGARSQDLRFVVETELETDGRGIAEIPQVPGALAYGATKEEAINKAYAIASVSSPMTSSTRKMRPRTPSA